MKKIVLGLLALALLTGQLAAMGRRTETAGMTITVERAEEAIEKEASDEGWSSRNRQRAIEVLRTLEREGVPVDTGLEAVIAAGDNHGSQSELTKPERIKELKMGSARNSVADEARNQNWDNDGRDTALNVLDQLIEEGVPVETAREAVMNTMRENKSPSNTVNLLKQERIREMKNRRMEKMERGYDKSEQKRDMDRMPEKGAK